MQKLNIKKFLLQEIRGAGNTIGQFPVPIVVVLRQWTPVISALR
jgi:hypothetical protein